MDTMQLNGMTLRSEYGVVRRQSGLHPSVARPGKARGVMAFPRSGPAPTMSPLDRIVDGIHTRRREHQERVALRAEQRARVGCADTREECMLRHLPIHRGPGTAGTDHVGSRCAHPDHRFRAH